MSSPFFLWHWEITFGWFFECFYWIIYHPISSQVSLYRSVWSFETLFSGRMMLRDAKINLFIIPSHGVMNFNNVCACILISKTIGPFKLIPTPNGGGYFKKAFSESTFDSEINLRQELSLMVDRVKHNRLALRGLRRYCIRKCRLSIRLGGRQFLKLV